MRVRATVLTFVIICCSACAHERPEQVMGEPGTPLSNLTESEYGRFLFGKAVFDRLTTPEEGLGPLFNEPRCFSCHDVPASGGSSRTPLVRKATRFVDGQCDLLADVGGDNIQRQATPLLQALGIHREEIPQAATDTVSVTAPELFGLGLVEAVSEADIRRHADPDDENQDGISGRAGSTEDGRLGRFGRKADVATIRDFVDTALRFELGLTTVIHPFEERLNGAPLDPAVDPMADPEIDERGLDALTDYIRFLAAPQRENTSGSASRDSIERGEQLFRRIGCADCHTPLMTTSPNAISALDEKPVPLYSDMLLHDMGPELADVCGANASRSEYVTARLWGLRYRSLLLHDGRAATPAEAILSHGGEASGARERFQGLTEQERENLLRFLASL